MHPYDGFKVDAWSCAVVLYNLVTGYHPFSGNKVGEPYSKAKVDSCVDNILNMNYTFPPECHLSNKCIDLIQGCLEEDPEKRMSITEIISHPWLDSCR